MNLKNKIRFKIIDLKSESSVAVGTKVVLGILVKPGKGKADQLNCLQLIG